MAQALAVCDEDFFISVRVSVWIARPMSSELCGIGARGPRQSGVSRFHPCRRCQDARREDHGRWGVAMGPTVIHQSGTSATAERPQPGPPPAVIARWMPEISALPRASTHCWSGWLDTASVAESQGRE